MGYAEGNKQVNDDDRKRGTGEKKKEIKQGDRVFWRGDFSQPASQSGEQSERTRCGKFEEGRNKTKQTRRQNVKRLRRRKRDVLSEFILQDRLSAKHNKRKRSVIGFSFYMRGRQACRPE